MWGGSLQFSFENGEIIAENDTHKLIVNDVFDFEDYKDATNTPPVPLHFQQLVQSAIYHELVPSKRKYLFEFFASFDIIDIILEYSATRNKVTDGLKLYQRKALGCVYSIIMNVPGLKYRLMPHQKQALEYAITHKKHILALDLGLGKTLTAFSYILCMGFSKTLVIVPASLKQNWRSEYKKMVDESHLRLIDLDTTKHVSHQLATLSDISCMYLISYSLLRFCKETLLATHFDAMVCDEAHAFQNKGSSCSEVGFALNAKIDHLCLLTGTPDGGKHQNIWNLLRFVQPEIFKHFFHYKPPIVKLGNILDFKPPKACSSIFYFAERYLTTNVVYSQGGVPRWIFKDSIRSKELHFLTRQYMFRQKKQDVLNLPPFERQYVVIAKMPVAQKKLMATKMNEALALAETKGVMHATAAFMEQVRETARLKIPFVLKYLTHLLNSIDEKEKCIIWAHHKEIITAIDAHLTSIDVGHIVVNGDVTSKKKREKLFHDFQFNTKTRVAVLSITACGTGLNLGYCELTIYAELTFLFKPQKQSEGRCHRLDSKGVKVVAQYLIMEDSTDEKVWKSVITKSETESLLLENTTSDFHFEKFIAMQSQLDDFFIKPEKSEDISEDVTWEKPVNTILKQESTSIPKNEQQSKRKKGSTNESRKKRQSMITDIKSEFSTHDFESFIAEGEMALLQ